MPPWPSMVAMIPRGGARLGGTSLGVKMGDRHVRCKDGTFNHEMKEVSFVLKRPIDMNFEYWQRKYRCEHCGEALYLVHTNKEKCVLDGVDLSKIERHESILV